MTMQTTEKKPKTNGKTHSAADSAPEKDPTATSDIDAKALWAAVKAVEAESTELQNKLEGITGKRSALLSQLKHSLGIGPFQISGLGLVTIRSRKSKVEGAPDTFFFVSMGSKSIQVID